MLCRERRQVVLCKRSGRPWEALGGSGMARIREQSRGSCGLAAATVVDHQVSHFGLDQEDRSRRASQRHPILAALSISPGGSGFASDLPADAGNRERWMSVCVSHVTWSPPLGAVAPASSRDRSLLGFGDLAHGLDDTENSSDARYRHGHWVSIGL